MICKNILIDTTLSNIIHASYAGLIFERNALKYLDANYFWFVFIFEEITLVCNNRTKDETISF